MRRGAELSATAVPVADSLAWTGAREAAAARFLQAFRRNRIAMVGLGMVLALLLLAGIGPMISPYDPYTIKLTEKHEPMSARHPLGTDFFGRDVLTRLMYGLRTSLAIAIITVSIGAVVGVTIGLLSAYYGRILDLVLMRL